VDWFCKDEGGASLDQLAAWIKDRRRHSLEAVYVCAWVQLGQHFQPEERVNAVLVELGGGEASPIDTVQTGSEMILFNEQSVIVNRSSDMRVVRMGEASEERFRAYQEFIIYGVFLNEALSGFSKRVTEAIDVGGRLHGSSQIRSDFLYFQTQYYHLTSTHDPNQRRFFQRVIDGLQVPDQYLEVQSELDRLGQASERASAHKMELLLFVIGLAGVVEALLALPSPDGSWAFKELDGSYARLISIVVSLGGAVLLYWVFRRRTKERESLDGR